MRKEPTPIATLETLETADRESRAAAAAAAEEGTAPPMFPTPLVPQGGRHVDLESVTWSGNAACYNGNGAGLPLAIAAAERVPPPPAMLPTPRSQDSKHAGATDNELLRDRDKDLLHVRLAREPDWPDAPAGAKAHEAKLVGCAVALAHATAAPEAAMHLNDPAPPPSDPTGPTRDRPKLNPTWVAWLQAVPPGWTEDAGPSLLDELPLPFVPEPAIPRVVVHGKGRRARLKCHGNAVNSVVAEAIGRALTDSLAFAFAGDEPFDMLPAPPTAKAGEPAPGLSAAMLPTPRVSDNNGAGKLGRSGNQGPRLVGVVQGLEAADVVQGLEAADATPQLIELPRRKSLHPLPTSDESTTVASTDDAPLASHTQESPMSQVSSDTPDAVLSTDAPDAPDADASVAPVQPTVTAREALPGRLYWGALDAPTPLLVRFDGPATDDPTVASVYVRSTDQSVKVEWASPMRPAPEVEAAEAASRPHDDEDERAMVKPVFHHAVEVTHTLKGGAESVALARLTLLVGPNASGKTTLANAVEFALDGSASDVEGAEVARLPGVLLQLATGEDQNAFASVTLDDGTVSSCTVLNKGDGRASKPKMDCSRDLKVSFPLRDALTGLRGKPDSVRSWLMRKLDMADDAAALRARLPASVLDRFDLLTDPALSASDNLLAVLEQARSKARSAKAGAEGAKRATASAASGLPERPTPEAVLAAAQAVVDAQAVLAAATTAATTAAAAATAQASSGTATRAAHQEQRLWLETKLAAAKTDLATLTGQANEIGTQITSVQQNATVTAEEARKVAARQASATLMDFQLAIAMPGCLLCGTTPLPLGTMAARRAVVGRMIVEKDDQREKLLAGLVHLQQHHAQLLGRIGQLQGEANSYMTQLQQLGQLTLPEVAAEASDGPILTSDLTAAAADAAVREATSVLESARALHWAAEQAIAGWDAVHRARTQERTLLVDAKEDAFLADVLDAIKAEEVDQAVASFEARVQKFIPEGARFRLVLTGAQARFGLQRDGILYSALSGAEWVMVLMAIAAAVTPIDADVVLITPPDRAWDAKTLREVMKAFANYPGQILMTSTVAPYRGAPKGWTLVSCGD